MDRSAAVLLGDRRDQTPHGQVQNTRRSRQTYVDDLCLDG
jgi:hypothetical protein